MTKKIAEVRSIGENESAHSPARFKDIETLADMKDRVQWIRSVNPDIPVGIKLAASHIERDLAAACELDVDWITLDGRAGGTGAASKHIKDNICVPTVFAIPRARQWLLDQGINDVKLCVTGGFRTAADVTKAVALGADGVALATGALMAIGCQQYRACHSNHCPVGIATQRRELRQRFDRDKSSERLVNYFEAMTRQMKQFARICGKKRLHDLSIDDLATVSGEIAAHTPVPHV